MKKSVDLQAVEIARKIYKLNEQARGLADKLYSIHPNGHVMHEDLHNNYCITYASAESVIHDSLEHPERWETVHGSTIRRKRKHEILVGYPAQAHRRDEPIGGGKE